MLKRGVLHTVMFEFYNNDHTQQFEHTSLYEYILATTVIIHSTTVAPQTLKCSAERIAPPTTAFEAHILALTTMPHVFTLVLMI